MPLVGNLLLDRIAGATITWVTPEEYADRDALMGRLVERYAADDRRAYAIPEGGSDAMGAWGYARMAEELNNADEHFDTLIHAVGSGGTSAGLAAGKRLLHMDTRMVGFPVCDDAAFFRGKVDAIGAAMAARWQLSELGDPALSQELELLDGFVGRGYGLTRPEELSDLITLARTDGIILDPVYSGKAWHGLVTTLHQRPDAFGERVLFLHTGGVFGLFGAAADLTAALDATHDQ